jgi:hypothetical protein
VCVDLVDQRRRVAGAVWAHGAVFIAAHQQWPALSHRRQPVTNGACLDGLAAAIQIDGGQQAGGRVQRQRAHQGDLVVYAHVLAPALVPPLQFLLVDLAAGVKLGRAQPLAQCRVDGGCEEEGKALWVEDGMRWIERRLRVISIDFRRCSHLGREQPLPGSSRDHQQVV